MPGKIRRTESGFSFRAGFQAGVKNAGLGVVLTLVVLVLPAGAQAAGRCPNETLRTGPAASLPDCRAYELVTPSQLARSQALTFAEADDRAGVASSGEGVVLETEVPLEPSPPSPLVTPSLIGARAVFSRTPDGWTMRSMVPPGQGADHLEVHLLSPDLSHVALQSFTGRNFSELNTPDTAFEVGPVGGPYSLVAEVQGGETNFIGANAGVPGGAPPLSAVLLQTKDHALALRTAAEEAAANETTAEALNLYEWSGGRLQLVNLTSAGALLNHCGAQLGAGFSGSGRGTVGAVSADGTKVFFTSPDTGQTASCPQPPSLFMRLDGQETVEISPLAGVAPAKRREVFFNGATPDGSEVLLSTETKLTNETPQEEAEEESEEGPQGSSPKLLKLFIYNTLTRVLTMIGRDISPANANQGVTPAAFISEDGSTVYYRTRSEEIWRYDVRTATITHVASTADEGTQEREWSYATPNGEFLVFPAAGLVNERTGALVDGVVGEPRGAGHNELYRYDAADGSVMCVSCGSGVAPSTGDVRVPELDSLLKTQDQTPPLVQMSEDGRRVFFQTTAHLVAQDTNGGERERSRLAVYEWEEDGSEEAPGVYCWVANGCTHLVSSGADLGPEVFLGASASGNDVFFASTAQLLPQATPEVASIYDARVDGGFAPPAPAVECTSCQGVGSPPPLFGAPASETFVGAGNASETPPVAASPPRLAKPKPKKPKPRRVCSHGHGRGRRGRCVRAGARVSRASAGEVGARG